MAAIGFGVPPVSLPDSSVRIEGAPEALTQLLA
jgi:hypothetical protein